MMSTEPCKVVRYMCGNLHTKVDLPCWIEPSTVKYFMGLTSIIICQVLAENQTAYVQAEHSRLGYYLTGIHLNGVEELHHGL